MSLSKVSGKHKNRIMSEGFGEDRSCAGTVKVVGLTGGIGTGKSTAAAYLKGRGFAHVDADEISRQLTADGGSVLADLEKVFGDVVSMKGGLLSLDRKAMAALVFKDRDKKKLLEDIMFRGIKAEIDRQIEDYRVSGQYKYILLDAPLLFEAELDNRCDVIVLLIADEGVRVDRVCGRDGVTERQVRDRINSQLSDEQKIILADIVIDNSGSEDALFKKLDEMICKF